MFERYTEPARHAIFYARYVAAQNGSPKIETEHLLVGLLRADMGLAQRFLGSPWAAEQVWGEVDHEKPVRPPLAGGVDLPLSRESKYVVSFAAEGADRLSSKEIRTDHLLLGLLREEGCFAAELLNRHGVRLALTREELGRNPNHYLAQETFVQELGPLPQDIIECQSRIRSIMSRMREAIANHDFVTARSCADEERTERDKLRSLYQQHGLPGWLFW